MRGGMLLVATPELRDPNFVDTVVLLLDVDANGVLGVVLNRPSPVPVADVLDPWAGSVARPDVLFQGGPVSPDSALAVALLADPDDVPLGFRRVEGDSSGRLGLLDLDTPPELVEGSLQALRIFAGYAGWSVGQLEEEIGEGDWYVLEGTTADVFRGDVGGLWRDVLRRQSGNLAWHSTRPSDPDLN